MIKIIRHGKGTVGNVVRQGNPIKYDNNLVISAPAPLAAPAPAPAPAKKKGKTK